MAVLTAPESDVAFSLQYRNRLKFMEYLRKRMNTNPSRGPYHFRAPSRMFWRVVRGMVPHKTARGQAAMGRLKVFDGIPHPYDKQKRVVVPDALKVTRIKPGRAVCHLGKLASSVGWAHGPLIAKLEEKRKVRSDAFYQTKKAAAAIRAKAIATVDA